MPPQLERPPPTRTVDERDHYHGVEIADPYRWLERGSDSPEVRAFIAAQNAFSERFLAASGQRDDLRARLVEVWNAPRFGTPLRRGERTTEFRNSGLQEQDVLWVCDGDGSAYRPLLDPNTLSDDGRVALAAVSVSPQGRFVAYALSRAGSDWRDWRVRDVDSGEDLPDVVPWSRYASATWLSDGSGFYYIGYPPPDQGDALTGVAQAPEVRLHRLGTDSSADETIYARPDEPKMLFGVSLGHDDTLLISTRRGSSGNGVLLAGENGDFTTLAEPGTDTFVFLGVRGESLLFWSDRDAPLGSIVAATPRKESIEWRTLVADLDAQIDHGVLVNDELVLALVRNAAHTLLRVDLVGGAHREVELPGPGALHHPGAENPLQAERFGSEVTFGFTTFLQPPTPYRLRLDDGELEILAQRNSALDESAFQTRRVFAHSRDGTEVPMFVVHRRGLRLDGSNPTLLYGYGGFGASQLPRYSAERRLWLEGGGVFVLANLRGGKEHGSCWHHAGRLEAKQRVFDDFIACAEKLIDSGVTSPERLAIQGRSNGGLLVGACLTQRPELFGAALPAVGVLDMLRYERFTVGWAWASEYGSVDDPEQFATLRAYSPLHNLEPGTAYPATLISTGDHDDRVVPAHSFKFAAALQAAQGGEAPILLRIYSRAGHGHGKPTALLIDEACDNLAFLTATVGFGR